ncbi:MAG TPA: L-aspartate oxidase [Spirochaetota bacterium]|jgi:L-aspartate oxidase|nr:L-aspartate oxidase [Spirochaetota bacterium]HPV39925.1 L-aspartate oxidase [Spirochaetota bacterium]
MRPKKFKSDFLVIGSGIAGLAFAIKASRLGTVNIVTKKKDFDSNTNYAQGGIASVLSPEDSFDKHIDDTIKAGSGLGDRATIELLVRSGPERIQELMDWGTQFSEKEGPGGRVLDLGREGGHSKNRIVHARDLTGQEVERALLKKVSEIKNIQLFEDHTGVDLLTEHQLKIKGTKRNAIHCYGAYILDNTTGMVNTFNAKMTLLATGGVGQVYLHTTNPEIATGDGIAMAYRAGALIADMEFIQFHPTALYSPKQTGPCFLISEAVRGEGAVLVNKRGERFMENVHPLKDLAPRDIVARTIDMELKKHGVTNVYLDITSKSKKFLMQRFPHIYAQCLEEGIDMSREPVPVVPAAHYLCGGVVSDCDAKTSIENLYVSGESSCTGVHGANRLASNSLLEGIVFSHRAYLQAEEHLKTFDKKHVIPEFPNWNKAGTFDLEEWVLVQHDIEDVKRLMWDYVGIVRSDKRLQKAHKRILMLAEDIHDYYKKSTISSRIVELRNLATVAKLIIRSALARRDSIGLHYNSDHPTPGAKKVNVVLQADHEPRLMKLDRS